MSLSRCFIFSFVFFFVFQSANAQVRLFAGPQITTAKYLIRNVKQATESKQSFQAGIGLTTLVEGPLFFSPSLFFSQKGYNATFNGISVPPDSAAKNNNTTIRTIAFAPLLQLNLSGGRSHFFLRFGPGFDYAFAGREVFDSTGNKKVDRSMNFGSTGYSPVTAFANFQLGFQHKAGFHLYANYEHGLSNLNNSDLGPTILHRIAGVSLGWRFGKRR